MYKIMIVEDEKTIATQMKKKLCEWDFDVLIVDDFQHIYQIFIDYQPHLVLLDIQLPYFNGYYWCEKIRQVSQIPILFISSASDNMNIVMAMTMGGDDFLQKPFDFSVFIAKIQALLRRTYDFSLNMTLLEYQDMILNHGDCTVSYHDMKVELSKNEMRILKVLLENKEKIVSREALMNHLWKTDCYIDENTLSVNVNRLRKKLEMIGKGELIKTKKGIGYYLK